MLQQVHRWEAFTWLASSCVDANYSPATLSSYDGNEVTAARLPSKSYVKAR